MHLTWRVAVNGVVVLGRPWPFDALGWPWLVPFGTAVTVGVGLLASLSRRAVPALVAGQ